MNDVPFVGREVEFGTLRACLAEAGRGRARVLLVGGEPGIGKTRFVGAAVGRSEQCGLRDRPRRLGALCGYPAVLALALRTLRGLGGLP
jgi:hypothetical protein